MFNTSPDAVSSFHGAVNDYISSKIAIEDFKDFYKVGKAIVSEALLDVLMVN